MIHFTEFRGASLEKATEYMNCVFDFRKAQIISIESKTVANVITIRIWYKLIDTQSRIS